MHFVIAFIVALVANLCVALSVDAQTARQTQDRPQGEQQAEQQGEQRGERPHGPPPESFAACKTLAAGAACSFTNPRGSFTGTCVAPEGKPLGCRPSNAPPPPSGSASRPAR
jgi:hypothetical protein